MKLDLENFKVKKPKESNVDIDNLSDFERILKSHGGSTIVEHKYDGNGVIIDTRSDDVQLYSLNKNSWNTECFPELIKDLENLPNGFYMGELVGKPTCDDFSAKDEFDAVRKRSKVDYSPSIEELVQSNPLEIRLYDVLEFEGDVIADKPHEDMYSILQSLTDFENILPVEGKIVDDARELQELTKQQFKSDKEGFVIKRPNSSYAKTGEFVKGGRTGDWLKVKRSVTFDYAILGLYQTPERLAQGWKCSNVLLGTYNDETNKFESISKLTLSRKEFAEEIYDLVAPNCEYSWSEDTPHFWENDEAPKFSDEVKLSERLERGRPKNKVPFMYVSNPSLDSPVVEVQAMEFTTSKKPLHSCGYTSGTSYSLRIPRFIRMRDDKGPLDSTTTNQVLDYVSKE